MAALGRLPRLFTLAQLKEAGQGLKKCSAAARRRLARRASTRRAPRPGRASRRHAAVHDELHYANLQSISKKRALGARPAPSCVNFLE